MKNTVFNISTSTAVLFALFVIVTPAFVVVAHDTGFDHAHTVSPGLDPAAGTVSPGLDPGAGTPSPGLDPGAGTVSPGLDPTAPAPTEPKAGGADAAAKFDQAQSVSGVKLLNPLAGINSLQGFIIAIIEILLVLAIPVIAFFIIYAGFLYVTARGNPEKVTAAHKALTWAVVGGVVILGAFIIVNVISGTINAFR